MADSFSYEQLIASGEGRLFSADSGRLPLPPMLMFDRIRTSTATAVRMGWAGSGPNSMCARIFGFSTAISGAIR